MNAEDYVSLMISQNSANNAFNAEQAQLNRSWQENMSNTAHQREVADLVAAGLSPVLSANTGASTTSGATASADTNATSGYASLAKTAMDNLTSIAMNNINAAVAMNNANVSAEATKAAAQTSAYGTIRAAEINQETQIEGNKRTIPGAITYYLEKGYKSLADFANSGTSNWWNTSSLYSR